MTDLSEIAWFRFRVALRNPVSSGNSRFDYREGLVVRIRSRDGGEGWGEAAPLPGFHGFCPIDDLLGAARSFTVDDPSGASLGKIPSMRFAISAAREWLEFERSAVVFSIRRVPTTLLVGRGERPPTGQHLSKYQCVKVKVGGDVETDARAVLDLKGILPPTSVLRADANRNWSLNQAIEFGHLVGADTLEFLEEPCQDFRAFDQVRKETGLRLAADESVQEACDESVVSEVLDMVDFVVVKPTMIGGLGECRKLAREARSRGKDVVVSSAYETGIGMRGILLLMNRLPESTVAAGLGTYTALEKDLLSERLPTDGPVVDFPSVLRYSEVDESKLERVI